MDVERAAGYRRPRWCEGPTELRIYGIRIERRGLLKRYSPSKNQVLK